MSGLGRTWIGVRGWVRRNPIYTVVAALIALVGGYGTLSGGVHAILSDSKSAVDAVSKDHKEPPSPNFNFQVVNVEGFPRILDRSVAPPGVRQVIIFTLTVRSLGDPIVGVLGETTTVLGGRNQIEWPQTKNLVVMNKGIGANTVAAIVPIRDAHTEMEGRIDWTFKYGPDQTHLDRTVPIRGIVSWDEYSGKWQLGWYPDPDSALPMGMSSRTAAVPRLLPS